MYLFVIVANMIRVRFKGLVEAGLAPALGTRKGCPTTEMKHAHMIP